MRKKTADALADWRTHAAQIREANVPDPGAFTVPDFAQEANIGIDQARKIIKKACAQGLYKPAKKLVNGRIRDAFVECKKA